VALPYFQLMFLRSVHRAADDLKNVSGCAAMAVLNADGNADNDFRAKLARGPRGNWRDQAAVGKAARADFYRLEQARKGTTGANRVDEMTLREYYRLAGCEVRGHHSQGNAQLFKLARLENALDQVFQARIAG